ncbi:hypothetical protein [Agromyces silvae]|uniref:hypothetical protein n=1 Tax=Agromyces silvae TaxID=3388266 RepID=UPI00280AC258|nr:hypothetical protein [Agromyces protaetiae]
MLLLERPGRHSTTPKAKVQTFLEKLQRDDASAGLGVKPMDDPADTRARTGRVDGAWRAVLYQRGCVRHDPRRDIRDDLRRSTLRGFDIVRFVRNMKLPSAKYDAILTRNEMIPGEIP